MALPRRRIVRFVGRHDGRSGSGAAIASFLIAGSGPEPRVADRIRDLGKLRDEGLIDDQTFDAKRADLLDRL